MFDRIFSVESWFGHKNRSVLGVQVQFECVIKISVLWSVVNWVLAMKHFLNSVVSAYLTIKEYVMKKLHAIVSVGVALLPVPGRADANQPGGHSTCTEIGDSFGLKSCRGVEMEVFNSPPPAYGRSKRCTNSY